MRKVAFQQGAASNISMLAGRAEQIPLAAGTADIVWLSTVVHHIDDLAAWAVDTRRVLKAGGWLVIRNLFADLGTTSWLAELPGAERAQQVFPAVTSIAGVLAFEGLELVDAVEVPESNHGRNTAHAAAAWIRMMRKADSLLLAFSDEEIAIGLDRLEGCPEDYALGPAQLGLAVFRPVS
jgi:SAM-dependent methyltransferase